MPKYKSLLSGATLKKRGGSKSAGSTSAGSTSGGSTSAGSTSGGSTSGGSKSGGMLSAGMLNFDSDFEKILSEIEKNPKMLLHILEIMNETGFHLIKEIARQHMGKKSHHHPKYVEKLKKNDDLFLPNKDIANNAKNLNHLVEALSSELLNNPYGGGLFKSIWHGMKSAKNWVNNNIIKKLPKVSDIQKDANVVLSKIRPITQGIDDITRVLAPELPTINGYVDSAAKLVNNPVVSQIDKVQTDVNKVMGNK